MRNSRLLEVLMDSALKVEIDEEMVCGIEHHMNKQFTDALCTMLKHPRKCPHDHEIPMGECCKCHHKWNLYPKRYIILEIMFEHGMFLWM